ncbi:hypothetical protein Nepgr_026532 [Nepenthes gracilis]|uniref:Homeobox-leucine zipper protein n=1 Tax=Nepenthes gracilis TaxID=150966 RepID=A0AAD3Y261_NEPGR|nr:hypothetical protein Nepgr_026532 [Nepenthes gracilis]
MKRLGSSDSLGGALMPICRVTDEHSPRNNHVYSRELQSMLDGLDEEGCVEESAHVAEKKRRLSVDQVKALEKNFEVENKLEPERKVKLAQELGLRPRQVAVWFQNRRARWKTKQLERDYSVLKANYDALKHNYDSLQLDSEALLREIRELKSKLDGENKESNMTVREEAALASKSANKIKEEPNTVALSLAETEANYDLSLKKRNVAGISFLADLKDRLSDSDSSAILNEDSSLNAANSATGVLQNKQLLISSSPTSSSFRFNCSSSSSPSSISCFKLSGSADVLANSQKAYQPQFVKMEEHNFFSGEESCNFFLDDQAPSLPWYCPDQWNQRSWEK